MILFKLKFFYFLKIKTFQRSILHPFFVFLNEKKFWYFFFYIYFVYLSTCITMALQVWHYQNPPSSHSQTQCPHGPFSSSLSLATLACFEFFLPKCPKHNDVRTFGLSVLSAQEALPSVGHITYSLPSFRALFKQ